MNDTPLHVGSCDGLDKKICWADFTRNTVSAKEELISNMADYSSN